MNPQKPTAQTNNSHDVKNQSSSVQYSGQSSQSESTSQGISSSIPQGNLPSTSNNKPQDIRNKVSHDMNPQKLTQTEPPKQPDPTNNKADIVPQTSLQPKDTDPNGVSNKQEISQKKPVPEHAASLDKKDEAKTKKSSSATSASRTDKTKSFETKETLLPKESTDNHEKVTPDEKPALPASPTSVQDDSQVIARKSVETQSGNIEDVRLVKMNEKLLGIKDIPEDLRERAQLMIQQGASSIKYGQIAPLEQAERYINTITKLPWGKKSQDNLELTNVKQLLNKKHYGMDSLKERIVEYLAVLKLQQKRTLESGEEQTTSKAPIVCFVGLVGTGKTTVAYSIAEAMGRQFVRIPFGGMGSAADLRGLSRIHSESEPGLVIKAFMQAKVMNPVILLDEIDRVTEAARADIMGVLVEMLDPKQNVAFVDHYLDYPFDLSQTIFIGTANNTKHIATAVMDRIEPLQMPSYSDKEKIVIGRDYVFPKQLKNCGLLPTQLVIADDIWQNIVRPTGFDAGIRTLERTINTICRKAARIIVEGKASKVEVTAQNIKQFVQIY